MTSTATGRTALPAEDEQAIRDLVARADQAQSDAAVLPGLHTDQAVIVNIAGRRLLGQEAFIAAMTAALDSPLKDIHTSVEIIDIRGLTEDAALIICVKTVHDNRPEADTTSLPATGALTYVAVRTSDGWRLALAQTTPIM
ncbi:MAG TPA: SgcJ/EcaC family oxidoreductase [Kribbella sp.]|uniref:SgcJ/EcaC family oxidoreductase n=1 Tax=Kribbella sp. TaxID=1871183 RepID=UPI002D779CD6|nr:SgcJ/EcaC family oxidoreductase [Kribbella sp.]HET6295054.1 SgcJ/EcaC family oxidoreductase [Kribbella sp.]